MHQMTWEEFIKTREYVEKKALQLMSHEKKNDAVTGVPLQNYRVCAYIFEAENGDVVDRMLRLDLFRLLKRDKNGRHEFVGGLFHALKSKEF
jgi:hypothetical protein